MNRPTVMAGAPPLTLVIGSNGMIGSALIADLRRTGGLVVGTTRRREMVNEYNLYLDLAEGPVPWQYSRPVAVAVICAGTTELEACRHDPGASARINVDGVSGLVKTLVASGAFVIYLSTNLVFDGSTAYPTVDDRVSPATEKGRQSAETERRLREFGESVAIVRLTKVLSHASPRVIAWTKAWAIGQVIHPFSDMFMSPIPLSHAISVLRLIADRRLSGVVHVSAEDDISYAEAAAVAAEAIGADASLVRPVSSVESGAAREALPAHTALDVSRLRSEFGIRPPDARSTVRAAFAQLRTLTPLPLNYGTRF